MRRTLNQHYTIYNCIKYLSSGHYPHIKSELTEIKSMAEKITLVCRINPSFCTDNNNNPHNQYQIADHSTHPSGTRKLMSSLRRDKKVSVFSANSAKSRLVPLVHGKPLTRGFIEENMHRDDDVLRLRNTILDCDVFCFDRVINGQMTSSPSISKLLYESTLKTQIEDLFNLKSSLLVVLGSGDKSGREQVLKGDTGLLHYAIKSILGYVKLSGKAGSGGPVPLYHLQVSVTGVLMNEVYDLAEERTVTNFRKTNKKEASVIKITYEQQFRSLIYLAQSNYKECLRKLEGHHRDRIHLITKFYLKRGSQTVSELSILKLPSLHQADKSDINGLTRFICDKDKEFLEGVHKNKFLLSLMNERTILPNNVCLLFLLNPAHKDHELSKITLKIAEEIALQCGKPFPHQLGSERNRVRLDRKYRDQEARILYGNSPGQQETINYNLTDRQSSYSMGLQPHRQQSESKHGIGAKIQSREDSLNKPTGEINERGQHTREPSGSYNPNTRFLVQSEAGRNLRSYAELETERERELVLENMELNIRIKSLEKQLHEVSTTQKEELERKKLEYIEKEIQYRRKIKKYKESIEKLEVMVRQLTNAPNRDLVESIERQRYQMLYQENVMIKEQNEMLMEKCRKLQNQFNLKPAPNADTTHQRSRVQALELKLMKSKKEKSKLMAKMKTMENEIGSLIAEKNQEMLQMQNDITTTRENKGRRKDWKVETAPSRPHSIQSSPEH